MPRDVAEECVTARPPCANNMMDEANGAGMKSSLFPQFGIPDADCDVSVAPDDQGLPRIWFRSSGNPVVALDLTAASQLRQQIEAAGELEAAQELAGLIQAAQGLLARRRPEVAQGGDDGSLAAHRIAEDRGRRAIAATQSGPVDAVATPPTSTGHVALTAVGLPSEPSFTDKVSERPQETLVAIRNVAKAIRDEINQQQANKRNDAEGAAQQNKFISFLEQVADGLDKIAEAIELAIKSADKTKQPFFLGRAADLAAQLSITVKDGLERNRAYITDCTFKFTTIAAGCLFLKVVGFDAYLASIVAAVVGGVPLDKIKLWHRE